MKISVFFFLLFLSVQAWAQSTPIVKDADGNLIGYLISVDSHLEDAIVIRPDELVVQVYMSDGSLDWNGPWYPSFQSDDCSGPALTDASFFDNVVVNRIEVGYGKESPRPVLLVSKGLKPKEYIINSSLSPMSCGTWPEPQTGLYVSQDDIKIEDPTQYGLTLSPDTNEWGYKGPLSLSLTKSDILFCNSFESCPSQ